ncbi:ubiquitin carboxyl-terminal hydrolase 4 isoform X3 [Hyalella azteca]|uniref:ubiquitinyl hydrolase 1 n=1 Tax=Hyalella azteca TaxID=294128 RepID=A0A8B7NFD0_HYAAZ|nr:ubiquitin carboxyl-terminal hydrolase 4 isoform X3 [Hyalella azteca]
MPVAPSVTSYYPSRSTSYYRSSTTPSASSYLGRTPSLDRSGYSSYTSSYGGGSYSGYTSSYASRYSATKPPRPSYTSSYSSESYRSRTNRDPSPARTSYYRQSSESRESEERSTSSRGLGSRSVSDTSSRYASSTLSSRLRDNSSSRDSGYSSRLTTSSRDRSSDIRNGNSVETKSYGPSASSYASNYRWEGRSKNKEKSIERDENDDREKEKVRVSERVRNYESFDDDTPPSSTSARVASEEAAARRKRDDDWISARRQRLGLSPIRKSRTSSPDLYTARPRQSVEHNGNDEGNEDDNDNDERRQSVLELRRKYDSSNLNGYPSDDSSTVRPTPTIRCESPTESVGRRRTDSGNYSRDSPTSNHASASGNKSDSESGRDYRDSKRLESPQPSRKNLGSPQSRSPDGRKSLTNGTSTKSLQHLDDPSCSVSPYASSTSSSYYSARTGVPRSCRVRERIAARVARELDEDDDSPPVGRKPKGGFSESSGLVGLRNIGNTCFLNSVTQCLSNTRCLLEYLVKEGYSSDINTSLSTMKGDLIRAFGNLISEMWTEGDSNRALNTGPFKTQIQKFAPTFTGYQQHDAQEFLRKLLEGLHEDVNRVTVRPRPIHTDIDDDLSDDQKAMESWKRYLRFDDSKIVNMFVGQLKSSLQCSHCSHTSVTFDPFWDLSLPIPPKTGTVRLNQCLDLFTKEEVMDGDERPTCSKCKERRKMTKSFSIQKFPQVLVLHLKRFSPTERWRGKLSCTVEFPVENLDLSKYASSSRSSCNYNLIGVANHSGTTYSGHYTAFCRHPYSLQWHEYNDSRVTPIPARRVCSSEAYVLFYELSSASKL